MGRSSALLQAVRGREATRPAGSSSHKRLIDQLWLALLVVPLLAWLTMAAGYQFPVTVNESLAANPSPLSLRGVYPPEAGAFGFQRWTTEQAQIRVPGVGSAPFEVRLRFFGPPDAPPDRVLRLSSGAQVLAEMQVRNGMQEVWLLVPAGQSDRVSGDLVLNLEVPGFRVADDPRLLGVSLDRLTLASRQQGMLLPPSGMALQLGLVALLSLLALRISGVATRIALGLSGLLCVGAGLLVVGGASTSIALRLQAALALPVLVEVLAYTLVLALILRLPALRQRQLSPNAQALTLVRLAVLLIFVFRLAGMLHPQFINIDHGLRANQLLLIADGQEAAVRERLEQQYEWGTREPVPYSLVTYYLLLPLTVVWSSPFELIKAVKIVTALIEATFPLLFLALMRQGPQPRWGAAWGGLIYAGLPVGYLFFHDGSFPTTIGIWLTLMALVALQWALEPAPQGQTWLRWSSAILLLGIAIAAYVTHLAFIPFLIIAIAGSLFFLGESRTRRQGLILLPAVGLAFLVGWVIVYRSYTLTLIQRTIPAYLGLIASEGSVGRSSDTFFGTPINSFPAHLVAHFRLWPVMLAGLVLIVLVWNWRNRFITHLGLGYAALLIATSLAEQWFGLWNKHMVFIAPLVALLSGPGCAWLWQRGRAGKLTVSLLLIWLFWQSLTAWGNRVLWYLLPPGAL
ncbi:hypothetical protein EYB53_012885 [Candidatus Chloroploca sp. M-50]|uniref:Glycosyltransferase RgtA/B/C/D-like domain-containing protein n=1 Tax=Candidatus Chloroploca mongolica TaxID=2528176 RepID=A0ABS4DBE3_9CHLR|nr:hypothetical protein [Candidatus Chloroploca mongolica]MBP1466604.1 hypothetical protein [Candidatus Chloroploca mongolica]